MHYYVKERREELGMTQAELVKKTGISRTVIYELENGFEGEIKIGTLMALLKALKCGINKIAKD